jgi:peptidoglycan-associated lipoprotein
MRAKIALLALMLTTAGCTCRQKPVTLPTQPEAAARTTEAAQPADTPATVADFPEEQPTARDVDPDLDELNRQGVLKTVYFDYDQDGLSDDARGVLQSNAQWLRSRAGYRVRIEGTADDRGTIEYNLALGQRRADSVREYLGSLGVTTGDLEVVSYGEEKPAADGSDDASWAQNRRADFVIVSKP